MILLSGFFRREAFMEGFIHSVESFGTVDGPGVRFVVFFQGCPMRCKYCHNPDTWVMSDATQRMTVEEIISQVERNRSFYKTGGITATGGEPMLQIDFLTALFEEAKRRNIHTCLDTSGVMFPVENVSEEVDSQEDVPTAVESSSFEKIDKLLAVTDLVMLDIKHMDDEAHKELTKHTNAHSLAFARYLDDKKIPMWIRHVVVPDITNQKEELEALGRFLATLSNVEKVETLPYHAMGKVKYDALNLDYPLAKTRQLSKEEAKEAYEIIMKACETEKRTS